YAYAKEIVGLRPEGVLVGFLAAEKIEHGHSTLDGIANDVGEEHDARGELGVGGVETGVVETDRSRVLEGEEARHRRPLPIEKPQAGPARPREGAPRAPARS